MSPPPWPRPCAGPRGRPDLAADVNLQWIADHTNDECYDGDVAGAVRDADVFIGVSAPVRMCGADTPMNTSASRTAPDRSPV